LLATHKVLDEAIYYYKTLSILQLIDRPASAWQNSDKIFPESQKNDGSGQELNSEQRNHSQQLTVDQLLELL
jgi:hypothetical protein